MGESKNNHKPLISASAKLLLDKIFVSVGALITVLIAIFITPIIDVFENVVTHQPVDFSVFILVLRVLTVPLIFFIYFKKYISSEERDYKIEIIELKKTHSAEFNLLKTDLDKTKEELQSVRYQTAKDKREMADQIARLEIEKALSDLKNQLAQEKAMQELRIQNAHLEGMLKAKTDEVIAIKLTLEAFKTQYKIPPEACK